MYVCHRGGKMGDGMFCKLGEGSLSCCNFWWMKLGMLAKLCILYALCISNLRGIYLICHCWKPTLDFPGHNILHWSPQESTHFWDPKKLALWNFVSRIYVTKKLYIKYSNDLMECVLYASQQSKGINTFFSCGFFTNNHASVLLS